MNTAAKHGKPVGMKNLLKQIKKVFPDLKYGYFNPPKEKFSVNNVKQLKTDALAQSPM